MPDRHTQGAAPFLRTWDRCLWFWWVVASAVGACSATALVWLDTLISGPVLDFYSHVFVVLAVSLVVASLGQWRVLRSQVPVRGMGYWLAGSVVSALAPLSFAFNGDPVGPDLWQLFAVAAIVGCVIKRWLLKGTHISNWLVTRRDVTRRRERGPRTQAHARPG